jgi:EpsI family protein
MLARAVIVSVAILAAAAVVQRGSRAESLPPQKPLAQLPLSLGEWSGRNLPAWDDEILAQLGADDHVNRRYFSSNAVADLYVGFYRSQRQGDSIHSPQNCLPGAGWQPVSGARQSIATADGRSIPVNRYVIQKDLDKQVVLYWFQGRGRVVANEYANRAFLVLDSLRTGRSDGALVRVMVPVLTTLAEAEAGATSFAGQMYPHLAEAIQ